MSRSARELVTPLPVPREPVLVDDPFSPSPGPQGSPAPTPWQPRTEGGSFNIGDYIQMVKRHWRLVASLTALCLLGAAIRFSITPREYQASAQIQIERRSLSTLAGSQSGTSPWVESWWNLEYYPTQYRLLQSRGLAERVVKNLRLAEDPEFNPGGAPLAGSSAGTATAGDDDAALGALAGRLLGGLEVVPIQGTQLVILNYRSQSPRLAAAIANGVAEAFIDWGIEKRSDAVGQASDVLEKQVAALTSEIAAKQRTLDELQRRTGLTNLSPETNVVSDRLSSLNQSYTRAKEERIGKESRYRELTRSSDEAIAETLSGTQISGLRTELLKLRQEYDAKGKRFKPEWPEMVQLKGRLDKQQQALDEAIRETASKAREASYAEYQTALRTEQGLSGAFEAARDASLEQNSAAAESTNLMNEIETKRQLLNELQRKQSEASVTSRLKETRDSNVRIVDRAMVPGGPFRPSLRRELSLGLMMGLLLGIGLVFLIEFLDRTVKDASELERLTGLPTLAVIPDSVEHAKGSTGYGYGYGAEAEARDKKGRWLEKRIESESSIELLPHTRPRLAISEAYRSLRTALLLSSAQELRVVTVTSAESGEGKTTTATNLAVVMAQLNNRRVLLVDGDLRKPRLYDIFKISNRLGLTNLLTGSAKLEEVVQRTVVPNLFLIPAGPIPPNPAELLASERMRDFLDHMRQSFDFVVVDSPPSLAVTDATLIGSLVDGILLCFSAGKVPREEIRACCDRLVRAEVKVLGTVLNRYRLDRGRYGKRYESYGPYGTEDAAPVAKNSAA